MMVCVIVILANALWRCTQVLRGRSAICPSLRVGSSGERLAQSWPRTSARPRRNRRLDHSRYSYIVERGVSRVEARLSFVGVATRFRRCRIRYVRRRRRALIQPLRRAGTDSRRCETPRGIPDHPLDRNVRPLDAKHVERRLLAAGTRRDGAGLDDERGVAGDLYRSAV